MHSFSVNSKKKNCFDQGWFRFFQYSHLSEFNAFFFVVIFLMTKKLDEFQQVTLILKFKKMIFFLYFIAPQLINIPSKEKFFIINYYKENNAFDVILISFPYIKKNITKLKK